MSFTGCLDEVTFCGTSSALALAYEQFGVHFSKANGHLCCVVIVVAGVPNRWTLDVTSRSRSGYLVAIPSNLITRHFTQVLVITRPCIFCG